MSGATRARTWVSGNQDIRILSDNHYTIAPQLISIKENSCVSAPFRLFLPRASRNLFTSPSACTTNLAHVSTPSGERSAIVVEEERPGAILHCLIIGVSPS